MPNEITENYEQIRIIDPSEFQPDSFRTHDIGKKGYSKRIAGRLKSTGKWATQSMLISLDESETMKRKLREDAATMRKRVHKMQRKQAHSYHTQRRSRRRRGSHSTMW